jgi:tetratricopeptide (TPR) repeat protein
VKAPRFFILSLILFFSYPLQFAGAGLALDPDAQFEYANECFSNQEYLRAVDEYSRFIYFFPESERVEEARYQIGMSYFRAGQFQAAIDTCRKNIDGFKNSDFARKSYFLISSAHMALDQPGDAIVNLNNLLLLTEDIEVQDQVNYALGWIYLELRWPLNHRPEPGVLEEARRHFKNISQQNWGTYRVEALLSDIDRLGSVPQKSPVLAGSLSIIPGAGQLYCKRYKDALAAFLLNGVFALAAYEAFDNESYALGSLITFVGLGFYAGNIYGAVSSAHKYNRKTGRYVIEDLKKKMNMKVGAGFTDKKVFLSFQYRF